MDYDVIVIGSGLAGVAAAINAAKTKKVAVIRKGYGATALCSGTFDIAGRTGKRGRPFKDFVSIPQGIGHILENEKQHPYSILSMAFTGDRFNEFITMVNTIGEEFFERLRETGIHYKGSWENNMLLPTQHGAFKATSFCQSSMFPGNLAKLMGRTILFIGFEKTPIHNRTRAEFLRDILSKYGFLSFKDVLYINVDIQSLGLRWNGHDFISLAGIMDDMDNARRIAASIREIVDKQDYDHIFIQPVMGIKNYEDVSKLFSDTFGDALSELVADSPSAPGLRLQYALDRMLAQHGVAVIDGEASCSESPDTIKTVGVSHKDGSKSTFAANSFILATGKFISNGLTKNKTWQESIFGLPAFIGDQPVKDAFAMKYLTDDPLDEQALFSMGVKVDNSLRPVDEDGAVVYKNLYAAGSVLSGYNYIYDKTGMGTALLTGSKAGIFSAG